MDRPTAEHGLGAVERRTPRPETPTFNEIPKIDEIIIPIAGIEYAWVVPESIAAAQAEYDSNNLHYTQIPGVPLVFVCGVPVALMGRGKAIRGAPPEATTCPVFIDENAAVRIDKARSDAGLEPLYGQYYPQSAKVPEPKKKEPGIPQPDKE